MVNLESKFRNWATQLKAGNTRFAMITRDEEYWLLVCDRSTEIIESLKIFIDLGDGLFAEYEYELAVDDIGDFGCALLFRGSSELLCKDCSSIQGFGIKGVEAPAKSLYVYMRTNTKEFLYQYEASRVYSLLRNLRLEQEYDITQDEQ